MTSGAPRTGVPATRPSGDHDGGGRASEAIRTEQRGVGVVHHALQPELVSALGEPLGVPPRDDRDRQLAVALDARGVLERPRQAPQSGSVKTSATGRPGASSASSESGCPSRLSRANAGAISPTARPGA